MSICCLEKTEKHRLLSRPLAGVKKSYFPPLKMDWGGSGRHTPAPRKWTRTTRAHCVRLRIVLAIYCERTPEVSGRHIPLM